MSQEVQNFLDDFKNVNSVEIDSKSDVQDKHDNIQSVELNNSNKNLNQHDFNDDDFKNLQKSLKNGCLIMIPEDAIINSQLTNYVNNIIKKYDEESESDPYIETSLSKLKKEFEEFVGDDKDNTYDLDEFCKKIYGGYIDGDNVMSTTNYDAEWSYCVIGDTYELNDLENVQLNSGVKCIVDLNGNMIRIGSGSICEDKTDNVDDKNNWFGKVKDMCKNNNKTNAFFSYIEYF